MSDASPAHVRRISHASPTHLPRISHASPIQAFHVKSRGENKDDPWSDPQPLLGVGGGGDSYTSVSTDGVSAAISANASESIIDLFLVPR